MKLFLAGGGLPEQSVEIDTAFLKSLPRRPRILYVPIALKHKYSAKDCFKWFSGAYPTLKENTEYVEDLSKTGNLMDFDAIYIGGGNTFSLLEDIRNSGFDKKLLEFARSGRIIYGGSAGAIILGATILSSHDDNASGLNDFSGLKLIQNTAVWPHYTGSEDDAIIAFCKKHSLQVLAISEEGGVLVSDKSLQVLGKNVCKFSDKGKNALN